MIREAVRLSALVAGLLAHIGGEPPLSGQAVAAAVAAAGSKLPTPAADLALTESGCSIARLGVEIPTGSIGEPVSRVTLNPPAWVAATDAVPDHCAISGSMAPTDRSPGARPILFRVVLPAGWVRRAAQIGGGGMNGVVPNLTGPQTPLTRGFVTYGSDSGHQSAGFGGRRGVPPPGGPPPATDTGLEWTLNEEAIRNLGYMQMKKTRDAAMVLIERAYGERPRFNYYIGTSQGGREGLMVAQRYPADYDGVISNVPIVSFSSLMLAPELIRIQEKPLATWVTPAKTNAIRVEFMRQCDRLDGLVDGVINNYVACRAIFDLSEGPRDRRPWAAKRCPGGVD
ncbi:MAG TPA: tannase/feruloyl esterase family alpha/beta hydrolase, partial [Vicinamibacterales bacterium]|nr:tannase/feruloyl esterase family alpha/beta hydrolase [Vicinamibacterales bacterium]